MNSISRFLAAAIVITPLLTAPAEARPTRTECGTMGPTAEWCVSPIGKYGVKLVVHDDMNGHGFTAWGNCSTRDVRAVRVRGWTQSNVLKAVGLFCENYTN